MMCKINFLHLSWSLYNHKSRPVGQEYWMKTKMASFWKFFHREL